MAESFARTQWAPCYSIERVAATRARSNSARQQGNLRPAGSRSTGISQTAPQRKKLYIKGRGSVSNALAWKALSARLNEYNITATERSASTEYAAATSRELNENNLPVSQRSLNGRAQ
jgi:hypothetical protein